MSTRQACVRDKLKQLAFNIYGILLTGSRRNCPLCNRSYRRFLDHGIGRVKRSDAKCPVCRSLERHRALWLFVEAKNLLTQNMTMLHCAPEPQFKRLLQGKRNIKYITADYSVPRCSVFTDLTRASFKSNVFDSIICNHVLEHIVNDGAAMKELLRVLKPGGWAILQSPIDYGRQETLEDPAINNAELREKVYGHYDHKRLYGQDYKARLMKAGFNVEEDNFIQRLSPSVTKEHRLDPTEIIYFCRKPQL